MSKEIPEEKIPRWASKILDNIKELDASIADFKDKYGVKIGNKGTKYIARWLDLLTEIEQIIEKAITPPIPITFDDILPKLKDKVYDGTYIVALNKGDFVLKTFRLKLYPEGIKGMAIKEEPIDVKMTKRYLEIATDKEIFTKPAPKDIDRLIMIDGRTGGIVER